MKNSNEKDLLKRNFNSGSRPTQQHFHDLIDRCFNETRSSYVSGYAVTTDVNDSLSMKTIRRVKGHTHLVPYFDRINTQSPHKVVYQYAIPVCNLGFSCVLSKVTLNIQLPLSASYDTMDNSKSIRITQQVVAEFIRINNGPHEIYLENQVDLSDSRLEIELNHAEENWLGIGIDIGVNYTIKSDKAVSDEFKITDDNEDRLEHIFGPAGCIFTP